MDGTGLFEYGTLAEGSYFGDISLLLDQPEEFSYCYNPIQDKPICILTVEADQFLKICNQYQVSKEVLIKRAAKKRQIFTNFKTITLIRCMKAISQYP